MRTRILVVLALGLVIAADKPKGDDAKKELKKFEGTWIPQAVTVMGREIPKENLKGVEMVFKGGKFTLKTPRGQVSGTIKVDPTTKPRSYDASATTPQGQTVTSSGIYEFKGDTLKVCYTNLGKQARPKDFKATDKNNLTVYKRKKS
jgi:uncharacterized protein (TIGR03067 family)